MCDTISSSCRSCRSRHQRGPMLFLIDASSIVKVLSSLCASARSVFLCIGRTVSPPSSSSWSCRSGIRIHLMLSSDTDSSTQRIGYTEFSGLGKLSNLLGVTSNSEPLRIQKVTSAPSSMSRSHRFATCHMCICCVESAILLFSGHKTKSCKHANQAVKRSLSLGWFLSQRLEPEKLCTFQKTVTCEEGEHFFANNATQND